MNKSIENMMAEHRLIEQVLGALDTLANRLQQGLPVPRTDVARFALFFREFADRLHHGKEEDRLFVKMNENGFPREFGPVGVMLMEHDAGREHVRALAKAGEGTGPLSEAEELDVAEHALAFVPLLLAHIQKEDNILYPMAQQALPPAAMEALDRECTQFEQATDLAATLVAAYPADADRLACAQACVGCAGHHG